MYILLSFILYNEHRIIILFSLVSSELALNYNVLYHLCPSRSIRDSYVASVDHLCFIYQTPEYLAGKVNTFRNVTHKNTEVVGHQACRVEDTLMTRTLVLTHLLPHYQHHQ